MKLALQCSSLGLDGVDRHAAPCGDVVETQTLEEMNGDVALGSGQYGGESRICADPALAVVSHHPQCNQCRQAVIQSDVQRAQGARAPAAADAMDMLPIAHEDRVLSRRGCTESAKLQDAGTHCERRRLAREVSSRIVRSDDSQVGITQYGRALIAIAQELQQRLKTRSRRRLRRHGSC